MEPEKISNEKIYNTYSKRFLTKNGQQYKKLIDSGYYVENNKLYAPKKTTTKPTSTPKQKTKQWIEKKQVTSEPVKKLTSLNTIIKPTLNHILKELSVQDLLSLYITDKEIHNILNNLTFLQELSNKHNIAYSTSFSDFLTNYNLHLIPYNKQYLYKLENNIEMPDAIFLSEVRKGGRHVTEKMRAILIDWLQEVNKNFDINICALGLAITVLDAYLSKVNVTSEELQLVGCVCLYITAVVFEEYPAEISDFIYIGDGAFTETQFENKIGEIMKVLNGVIIRPSVIFYIDKNDVDMLNLALISYYTTESMIHKPSLIYETIHYMLYGTYKIYTLDEINNICTRLHTLVKQSLKTSLVTLKKAGEKVIDKIKFTCGKIISPIKLSKFVYNNEWHIQPDTPKKNIKTLGEGTYGKVEHINMCDKDYAIKTSTKHLNESITEIIILKNIINHPNIVFLCHFEMEQNKEKSILYMPLMNGDLSSIIENNELDTTRFPTYFKQIVSGLHYCHEHDIMVRDIKPQNILYNKTEDQLKLIDFGISVPYALYHYKLMPDMAGTLWFRAPEALLGDEHYTTIIDVWALGCVFCYMVNKTNMFKGDYDKDMLHKIFQILGTPNEQTWPGVSKLPAWRNDFPQWKAQNLSNFLLHYVDIIGACLIMDPTKRSTTQQLLSLLHNNYNV